MGLNSLLIILVKCYFQKFEAYIFVASAACSPSRTTLYTGHYSAVHGISQTYGLAKDADDPAATFLAPGAVPTVGNFFQEAGYETRFVLNQCSCFRHFMFFFVSFLFQFGLVSTRFFSFPTSVLFY